MGDQVESINTPLPAKTEVKQRVLGGGIDIPLILTTLTLIIFGLLMIYSASWDYSFLAYQDPTYIFKQQLTWLAVGIIVAVICAMLDYHRWEDLALPAIIITLVLLAIVLFMGKTSGDLRPVRSLIERSVRPSELAKLTTILYLSVWLISHKDQLNTWNLGFAPLAAILGLMGAVIAIQPDLSAAMTVIILGGLLFFLAGSNFRQITVFLLGVLFVGMILILLTDTTRKNRLTEYIEGLRDPVNASFHVKVSLGSFAKGGWIGVGVGKSDTKLINLPVPFTDSIFAVVGEETGFLGASLIVLLFIVICWRSLLISHRAPDSLGKLIAAGLGFWIMIEAIMNMGGMLGLLPFPGNALPLISYGGSNLVVTLAAIGILLNISRLAYKFQNERIQPFHAVVDLRGRHGRRRVPRFVYPSSHVKDK